MNVSVSKIGRVVGSAAASCLLFACAADSIDTSLDGHQPTLPAHPDWQPTPTGDGGEIFQPNGPFELTAEMLARGMVYPETSSPTELLSPPPTWVWDNPQPGASKDPQIAVGHNYVIVTSSNGNVDFYAKSATPTLIGSTTTAVIFSQLGLSNGGTENVFWGDDTRVIFDEFRNRFILIDGGRNSNQTDDCLARGRIGAAFSETENPADGWWTYWWDCAANWGGGSPYIAGDVCDFPLLGVSSVALLQTINVDNRNCNTTTCLPACGGCCTSPFRAYQHVVYCGADNMANDIMPANCWSYYNWTDPNGNLMTSHIQPAVEHYETLSSPMQYFVGRWGSDVLVWGIKNPMTFSQSITRVDVPTGETFGSPPDAPQPPEYCIGNLCYAAPTLKMGAFGTEAMKAIQRRPYLYLAAEESYDWFGDGQQEASIRLVRMNTDTFPTIPTTQASGFLSWNIGKNNPYSDQSSWRVYYGFPTMEVNSSNVMLLGFMRSGLQVYPEVRYDIGYPSEGVLRSSALLRVGDSYIGGSGSLQMCDIAGAAVDPSDGSFWLAHLYATSSHGTGLAVGKIVP